MFLIAISALHIFKIGDRLYSYIECILYLDQFWSQAAMYISAKLPFQFQYLFIFQTKKKKAKKEIDLLNWFDGFISWNTHISIMFTINMSVFPSIWPISNKLFSVRKCFSQDEVYRTDQIIGVPKACIYINMDLQKV